MSRLEAPPTILLNLAWEGLPAAIEDDRPPQKKCLVPGTI